MEELAQDENIYMVRLAEQTERYEDMQVYIQRYINEKKTLGEQERNLFAIAYKNLVSSRRTAWRAITALEAEQTQQKTRNIDIIKYYKMQVEAEIKKYCLEILNTIEEKLLGGVKGSQTEIYYLKMQGDYYRYLSEITTGEEHKKYSGSALQKYQKAQQIAEKTGPPGLAPTEPLRLGLCLNFSVFYYEIMNNPEEACSVAKDAFDLAIKNLDQLDEGQYKDSTTIMQLLRDNITMWLSEQNEVQDDKKDENVGENQ